MRVTLNSELALAARKVSAAYGQLPEHDRPPFNTSRWVKLADDVRELGARGNRDEAHALIEAWLEDVLAEVNRRIARQKVTP